MKKRKRDIWYLPPSVDIEVLTNIDDSKFTFEIGQSQKKNVTYLDTFDWRLYRHGCCLQYCEPDLWRLLGNDTDKLIELQNGPALDSRLFSWNFPTGKLYNSLESMLDVRALLPLITLESTITDVRILNSGEDTVGFLEFEEQQEKESSNTQRTVRLHQASGYGKEIKSIYKLFRAHDIVERVSARNYLKNLLHGSDHTPGDYNQKFSIQLNSHDTSRQSVLKIYKHLLNTMLLNENGILDDLDSEFLHDFRVALRRIRSGLTQMKDVIPLEVTQHFKEQFSYIGGITGPTRDLDVFLLYKDDYKSRLPPALQPPLHEFFNDLEKRRVEEQKKLVRALQDERYSIIMTEWQEYLENKDATLIVEPKVAVTKLAYTTITRQYIKILKNGTVITHESPDEDLHSLRIQGKKLRYSLEFFASLFAETKVKRLIKQLKLLQNNLGTFNDLSVQQDMLHVYLKGLRPASRKNFELNTAIGGLLTNLYHEQQRVREDFFSTFKKFGTKKNTARWNELFN